MTAYLTRRPRNRTRAHFAALAALALVCSVSTGSAVASPGSGHVVLSLTAGKADSSLLREDVKVAYSAKAGKTGATKSAATYPVAIKLPVAGIALRQGGGTLTTEGALKLRHGKRVVRLRRITVQAANRALALTAKLGGERLVFFRATGPLKVDGGSAKLKDAPLSLTAKGAEKLGERLGFEQLAAGPTGRLSLNAKAKQPFDKVIDAVTPKGDTPTPAPIVDPYSAQCGLPATKEVSGTATPALPRTELAGAPDLSEGTIAWGFRISFREYLATIAGGHATGLGGATVVPPPPSPVQVGTFEFPAVAGQYLANATGDGGDDQAVVDGEGEIVLCAFHKGAGFRVTMSNPTVTIDGGDSRLTVDVSTNMTGVLTPVQRVDVATIDPVDADVEYAGGPRTVTWEDLPTELTQEGLDALQLCNPGAPSCIYSAGDQLDPLTVEIAEPWSLAASCDLSGIDPMPAPTVTPSWPAAPAAAAALPTLSSPLSVDTGAIKWGVRNALRGTINGTGEFNLSGGATSSHSINPKEMSGAGKFFTWPATSGQYEPGTPGRLVLHGTGTVGLCQIDPNQAYGTVISNPTLVLDGPNSRLVLNVSTVFRNSWTGFGPIDAVSLDIADVVVATTPGPGVDEETVTWTFPDPGADNAPGGGDDNTDSANSAVKMAAGGTSGFWLLGNFGPTSPYRTVGSGLNALSVSIVTETD